MMNNYIINYDQMRLILDTSELNGIHNTVVLAISKKNTDGRAINCGVYFGYQEYINNAQANLNSEIPVPGVKDGNLKKCAEACANLNYEVLCTLSLALEIIKDAPSAKKDTKADFGLNFEDSLRHSMVNALIGSGLLTLAFDFNSSSILSKISEREKIDTLDTVLPESESSGVTMLESIQASFGLEEELAAV